MNNRRWISRILATGLVLGAFHPVPGLAAPPEQISLTVYRNFALVKEIRSLDLERGIQEVRVDDVAASLDPTSVHIQALDRPGQVTVLEQDFRYDLAGGDRLLERYLDRPVTCVLEDGSTRLGTLLSFEGGSLVLGLEDGGASILQRDHVRDVLLGEVPGGLVTRPTLVWTLEAARRGSERAEITYLADHVGWHAEYVAVVNEDDTGLVLDGWVSLDNRSGATYPDARLKLVAGDVRRVEDRQPTPVFEAFDQVRKAAPQFQERDFFEYHIYILDRPATIADRETKQLSLMPTAQARVKKVLTYEGQRAAREVAVKLEFDNTRDNGLGLALPAGKVRVYKADRDAALEFAGEDRIDHTPRDETVRLYLGNAFDVVGERTVADYKRLGDRSDEQVIRVEIRNHKDEPVDVLVVEHHYGDWRVLESTVAPRKRDASTLEFPVSVPPDSSVTVSYTIRTNR